MNTADLLNSNHRIRPSKIALIYFIISFFWIFFSDKFVEQYFPDISSILLFQTLKGLFFISATSLLIYLLIKNDVNKLIDQKNLFQNIFEISPVGIIIVDNNGKIQYANNEAEKILGLKKETIQFRDYNAPEWKITSIDGSPFPDEELPFSKVKKFKKQFMNIEHAIEYPDKRRVLLSINASPVFDKKDSFEGMIASIDDITEKKSAEEILMKTNELLINTLESMSDGFVSFDNQMNYTYVNKKAGKLLGRIPEDLIGKNYWIEYPEAKGSPFANNYVKALETQEPIIFEDYYSHWERWFENRIYPSEKGLSIFFQDINERKKSEATLRKWEEIFKNAQWGVAVSSRDGNNLAMINPAFASMHGYTIEELINKPILDVYVPNSRAELPNNIRLANEKGFHSFESYHLRKDGTTFPVQMDITVVKDEKGEMKYRIVNCLNITDRKKAELLTSTEAHVLELIAKQYELPIILEKIVTGIETMMEDTIASILLLDEDGIHVHYGAAPNLPQAYNDALEGAPIGQKAGSCGTAMFIKKPVIVSDIGTDPLWDDYRELANQFGLRACWSTPIMNSEGTVFGSFAMYYKEPRIPKNEDLKLINRVTALASIAIEHYKTESALKESNHYNRLLFETSLVGLALCRMDGSLVDVNPTFANIIGRSIDETLKLTYWDITPEKYSEQEKFQLELLEKTGNYGPYEKEYIHKDGHFIPVRLQGQIIERKGEKFIWSSVEDITKRKKAEAELNENRRVLQLFIEHAPASIAMFDTEMKYIAFSNRFLEDYDLKEKDITGKSHYEVFPEIPERWKEIHKRCLAGEVERCDEDPFPRANGKTDWIKWEIRPWYKDTNKIGGIILFSEVITERKYAEEKLKESEERYRQLLDLAPVGIAVHQDGKIVFTNNAGLELIGAKNYDELIGKPISQIIHPDNLKSAKERIEKMMNGVKGLYPTEDVYVKLDGTSINVEVIATPLLYNGRPAIQVIVTDISIRKKAEQQLLEYQNQLEELTNYLQTAREEEREAIAREIHDEFGQVLTSLKMNLTLIKRKYTSNEKDELVSSIDDMTKLIDRSVQHMRKLITELRPEILDKLGLIPALEWQIEEFINKSNIKTTFTCKLKKTRLNKNEKLSVYRILQESLTNINKHSQATEVNVVFELKNNNYILTISDNGIGIDETKIKPKSFGIIGMKERTKLIGGSISFDSSHGNGTKIIMSIHKDNP